MNVLICGFEPFGGRQVNNSWEVAKLFEGIPGIDVLKVPVSFRRAHEPILDALGRKSYDLVIMLGETSFTQDCVRLERLAINYMDSSKPDNDGLVADDEAIAEKAPKAYFSPLPLKKFMARLKESGHKVKITNTAGTFVCNSLYYHVLRHLEETGSATAALFIHLPVSTDTVSLKEMADTAAGVISCFESMGIAAEG